MNLKEILNNSFLQLLLIYTILIIAISLNLINKYTLYFNILAIIIAILGISILHINISNPQPNQSKISKKLHITLFIIAIFLIIMLRIIPYTHISMPLGYDAGLYKYGIEHGLENKDKWILNGGMEPGFLYLTKTLSFIFSTDILLKYIFIFFIVLLGFAMYMFTKEYYNSDVAIITLIIYSISLVQFTVFTYLYYKNIIALSLIFFAFYFLHKKNYKFFIICGILIGAIHRPSFYIFGLSYFFYVFSNPYNSGKPNFYSGMFKNILIGIIILAGALLFYLGSFQPAITSIISPVVGSFVAPGESPGTFITFNEYQFSILFYLPLAILGLFYLIKNRKIDIFFFYTILLIIIVYFQFFFFNRFIIFLDTALIVCAGIGSTILLKYKPKLGLIILLILLISGLIITGTTSIKTKEPIPTSAFESIQAINNIPNQAYIISVSSAFSPYLQGYTNNKIIAPGLFDYDIWHSESRWVQFWQDYNASELKDYYKEDIYLFTNKDLNTTCYQKSSINLYKWMC